MPAYTSFFAILTRDDVATARLYALLDRRGLMPALSAQLEHAHP